MFLYMARWLNWLERPVHTREVKSSSLFLAIRCQREVSAGRFSLTFFCCAPGGARQKMSREYCFTAHACSLLFTYSRQLEIPKKKPDESHRLYRGYQIQLSSPLDPVMPDPANTPLTNDIQSLVKTLNFHLL